jgi:hypothetical protein
MKIYWHKISLIGHNMLQFLKTRYYQVSAYLKQYFLLEIKWHISDLILGLDFEVFLR